MKYLFLITLSAALFAGCQQTYNEADHASFDKKIKHYLEKSPVKYRKSESGLYYFIEKEGEGEYIKPTDEVSFVYQGKLLNGTIFDGENRKKPVTFKVKKLIMGWQEAMLYLKKGGKIKLIVPPQLGYGDYSLDDIPPNSVLLFDMEVTDVN
ncbi:MAG: slyD [Crocinitomicaceae bacterium]|jgi:FKBP-type peptidyl-prolyl cis-trans isomerase FkpA|nr:slyD [Crocinitomicaceae bacterium]